MAAVASASPSVESQLLDVGKRLVQSVNSKDALFKVLKQASALFSEIEQSPSSTIVAAMKPSMDALPTLIRHKDKDVRVLVATCISEIMRIVAPDAPYTDEVLKEIFELIIETFKGLNETSSPYFARRVSILETVAKVRSCLVMLDLECDDLILEMFQTFFSTRSEQNVMIAMRTIMCLVLDESEEIPQPLFDVILSNLLKEKKGVSSAANQLAIAVFERCAENLEPYVTRFLTTVMAEGKSSAYRWRDYHEMIYELYRCVPKILLHIIPKLIDELLTDKVDVRLRTVKLLGRLFAAPGQPVPLEFKQLFAEFLKRFTDKAVEVRLSVVECAKQCLLANPVGESEEILAALSDRLQDYDNEVRKQVVIAICDFAKSQPDSIPMDIMKRVAERLRDTQILVRWETLQRLTEVYKAFCLKRFEGGNVTEESFSWIPSKIIRCCFDKDCKEFRPQAMELVFSEGLFPSEFPVEERVKCWISFFAAFDKNDVKAFKRVLLQKQRLQHEMQNYLSLRHKLKEDDSQDNQKKLQICCKGMLSSFVDPAKAEEEFQKLNQLKDNNLLKDLAGLLDPNTTLSQSQIIRDELLERIGEKHPQWEFIRVLAAKCSHILFGKEHLKALFAQIDQVRQSKTEKMLEASMGLLVEFTSHFPTLLEGAEDDLLQLLKEDNQHIKEGVVQILAKAGGTLRGQLTEESGSVNMELEKLCIEGSRKQAKFAVQALAAITIDSGNKALLALYRKLVDLLETGAHLPTVLQSLGCIAQNAMSVFETREEDIVNFLVQDLFRRDVTHVADVKTDVQDVNEATLLKIFGLKTLVKSFLPNKDAQQRQRIKGVFGILVKFLECGEVSDEVQSSEVDKAHLRLAAAKGVLRLSRRWDSQISPQMFRSTVLVAKDSSAHVRQQFLRKAHQCLKERAIPHKYACAFALNVADQAKDELEEAKQYIGEFVETFRREVRLRQGSVHEQSDVPLMSYYPECVLFYLVHVLAHEATFPVLSDGGPSLDAVDPFFKQLAFFIWALVNQAGEGRYDANKNVEPENVSAPSVDVLKTEANQDGECQRDVNKKGEPDTVSLILAIFRVMKHSEDAVDVSKTENTYILCDIGISIIKGLAGFDHSLARDVGSIPLPVSIYKALEDMDAGTQKEDGSHLPACLRDIDVLSHMKEILPFQIEEAPSPDLKLRKRGAENGSLEEEDGDQSHKRSKLSVTLEGDAEDTDVFTKTSSVTEKKQAQGRKKNHKEKARPVEIMMETGTSTPELKASSPSKRKRGRSSKENGEISLPDVKRGRADETLSSLVSGRQKRGRAKVDNRKDESLKSETDSEMRSPDAELKSGFTTPEIGRKAEVATPGFGSEENAKSNDGSAKRPVRISIKKLKPPQESVHESPSYPGHEEGALPESAEENKREGRRPRKVAENTQDDAAVKAEAEATRSPRGTPRRSAKKISISGLESPDSKSDQREDAHEKLVGRKIKVWWPMDKEFYEGIIESFDASKKRHKVVYQDGDVEVLNLAKERWELLDGGVKPLPKDQPGSPSTPSTAQLNRQSKKNATTSTKSRAKGEMKVSEETEAVDKEKHKEVEVEHKSNTATKSTPKARRQVTSAKAEKKTPTSTTGKGSKASSMTKDDLVQRSPSPTASNVSKDSDDVPLDVWKGSRRKSH